MTYLGITSNAETNSNQHAKKRKNYGSAVGYITAKGFLWAAEAGMQHVWNASKSEDVISELRKNRGVIISSAINLSLSAELAIKCLLSAYGLKVPIDHDLLKLYRKLPPDLKSQLSKYYDKNIGCSNCVIQLGDISKKQFETGSSSVVTGSLEEAIQRSRRTFNKHRFIYEMDSKPDTYEIDFHFTELRFIVEALLAPCSKMYGESFLSVKKDSGINFSVGPTSSGKRIGQSALQLTVEAAAQLSEPARYFLKDHKNITVLHKNQSEQLEVWRLPAAVVGVTLAIEMCFKSMCLALSVPYDDGSHTLIDGYHDVPKKAQQQIQELFEQRTKEHGMGRSYTFTWSYTKINSQNTHDVLRLGSLGLGIEDILERASNSFIDWRYCYENSSNSGQKDLEIPLGAIVFLADAIIITAVDVINRPTEYI